MTDPTHLEGHAGPTYSGGQVAPANPRQHPDFEPGNTLSLRHGYHSRRRVDPRARELVDMVLGDPDLSYLHAAPNRPALWAWAVAEARAELLGEYLARAGDATGDGVGDLEDARVRTAYGLLHRAETRAENGRKQLGLDPLSRARLGKDVAMGRQADAAAELTRMREEHERAERARQEGDHQ